MLVSRVCKEALYLHNVRDHEGRSGHPCDCPYLATTLHQTEKVQELYLHCEPAWALYRVWVMHKGLSPRHEAACALSVVHALDQLGADQGALRDDPIHLHQLGDELGSQIPGAHPVAHTRHLHWHLMMQTQGSNAGCMGPVPAALLAFACTL